MSRVGKMPVAVPQGVDVTIDGRPDQVKGPLRHADAARCNALVKVENDGGKLTLQAPPTNRARPMR